MYSVVYFEKVKVRLEHSFLRCQHPLHLFQFHKGTIRTSDNEGFKTSYKISIP